MLLPRSALLVCALALAPLAAHAGVEAERVPLCHRVAYQGAWDCPLIVQPASTVEEAARLRQMDQFLEYAQEGAWVAHAHQFRQARRAWRHTQEAAAPRIESPPPRQPVVATAAPATPPATGSSAMEMVASGLVLAVRLLVLLP
jgi:hypothetical protein